MKRAQATRPISIHALREEGDITVLRRTHCRPIFLSTPSARRATGDGNAVRRADPDFYPRPPRGGRHITEKSMHRARQFLSTPSARRATLSAEWIQEGTQFLSTPSARRATLRMVATSFSRLDFYPRPPRGGRHGGGIAHKTSGRFLSTPSVRRATRAVHQ